MPVNKKFVLWKFLISFLGVFPSITLFAQDARHLNITQAYTLARKNYPMIKQTGLIAKTSAYTISNAAKGHLPVLNINGQATYQSDVTNIPFKIPGVAMSSFSKDQYKVFGEVDQELYGGGLIRNQKQTARANELIQQQNLEVNLYSLYDRVNQIYLGSILIDEQIKQNNLQRKDIQNGIDKTKALVTNGTAFKSSVDELSAQLMQNDQALIQLKSTRKAYRDMLGLLINMSIDESVVLDRPESPKLINDINRPELALYDYQKKTYDLQDKFLYTQIQPKLNLFFQGGYGRPALNMLSNDFEWYYIGGVKLNWSLGSLYTLRNQKALSGINRDLLDIQKETFILNTRITQMQQNGELQKFLELLNSDTQIIALRESVKRAAEAQLENGVLSAHDFINQLNAEDEARQNKILHEIQLLLAQYNLLNTTGNINVQ
jgi:outer membrane protein TolC